MSTRSSFAHLRLQIEDFDDLPRQPPSPTKRCTCPRCEAAAGSLDCHESSYDEGLRAGQAMRVAADQDHAVHLACGLSAALASAEAQIGALADETAVAIAQTVFAMIAALLPATLAAHGDHEIRALASAILPTLAPAPDLAMDVAEEDAVGARAAIALLPAGQQGRIELCTHALTQPGSIIVRWTGGSVRRDTAAALRQVRVVLDEFGLIAPISQPQEALIYG